MKLATRIAAGSISTLAILGTLLATPAMAAGPSHDYLAKYGNSFTEGTVSWSDSGYDVTITGKMHVAAGASCGQTGFEGWAGYYVDDRDSTGSMCTAGDFTVKETLTTDRRGGFDKVWVEYKVGGTVRAEGWCYRTTGCKWI
ncbi:hypothetical protein ACIBQX_13595 [Nonomuraea sp. NPDC049714]|uniref:hypothetical protein n=1 Tax=Nonomuraea sp. NPDC049714 TaxID=3364357 RepID=UPI00379330E2